MLSRVGSDVCFNSPCLPDPDLLSVLLNFADTRGVDYSVARLQCILACLIPSEITTCMMHERQQAKDER